jgi:hypothetical protein
LKTTLIFYLNTPMGSIVGSMFRISKYNSFERTFTI